MKVKHYGANAVEVDGVFVLRRLEYAILEEVSAGPWCNHAKLRGMRHLYRRLVKKYGRR